MQIYSARVMVYFGIASRALILIIIITNNEFSNDVIIRILYYSYYLGSPSHCVCFVLTICTMY